MLYSACRLQTYKAIGKPPPNVLTCRPKQNNMSREYDLSDPTDLEVLKSDFEFYSADEWQEFIDWSLLPENKKQLSFEERGCLMAARKKALYNSHPSSKQMVWALKIADKIEEVKGGSS